jgi:hypothetical protein
VPRTLRVYAHWEDGGGTPPGTPPLTPPSFSGYPGLPSPLVSTAPPFPHTPVWCELARQDHIDAADWSGPNWPGSLVTPPQPPEPDQGFNPTAIGFQVSRINALCVNSTTGGPVPTSLGTNFQFTLIPPGGSPPGPFVLNPANNYQIVVPTPFDGWGIWYIDVAYSAPGFTTATDIFLSQPSTNSPRGIPFFSPFAAPEESILAIEFTGDEIGVTLPPPPPPPPPVCSCPDPQIISVSAGTPGPCDATGKRRVDLIVNSLPLPPGCQVVVAYWNFGDGPQPGGHFNVPGTTFPHPTPHDYVSGSSYTATLEFQHPSGCPGIPVQVTVPPCPPPLPPPPPPPPCPPTHPDEITDITFQDLGCNPDGTRTIQATAVINVPSGTTPTSVIDYTWQWDQNVPADPSVMAPQGGTQSHNYPAAGSTAVDHWVIVTVKWADGCIQTYAKQVNVAPCPQPTPPPPPPPPPPVVTPPPPPPPVVTPPPPPTPTPPSCGSLIWAAVIILAIGITLLAIHVCVPIIGIYLMYAGWILVAIYAVLMIIVLILAALGICRTSLCEVAAIHVAVLGPLGGVLAFLKVIFPCIWDPALWLLAGIMTIWAPIAAACILAGLFRRR